LGKIDEGFPFFSTRRFANYFVVNISHRYRYYFHLFILLMKKDRRKCYGEAKCNGIMIVEEQRLQDILKALDVLDLC
jgi:hypothetical protein